MSYAGSGHRGVPRAAPAPEGASQARREAEAGEAGALTVRVREESVFKARLYGSGHLYVPLEVRERLGLRGGETVVVALVRVLREPTAAELVAGHEG